LYCFIFFLNWFIGLLTVGRGYPRYGEDLEFADVNFEEKYHYGQAAPENRSRGRSWSGEVQGLCRGGPAHGKIIKIRFEEGNLRK